jgi:hypothetical protein
LHQTRRPLQNPARRSPLVWRRLSDKTELHGSNGRLIRAVLGANIALTISPEKWSGMDEAQHPFPQYFWWP